MKILVLLILSLISVSQAVTPHCGLKADVYARCDNSLSYSIVTSSGESAAQQLVADWSVTGSFTTSQVLNDGDIIRFYCKNLGGPGAFKAQVTIDNIQFYTDASNSFQLNIPKSTNVSNTAQKVLMDDTKYPVTAYKADKILIMSSNAKWIYTNQLGKETSNGYEIETFDFTLNCLNCITNCLKCSSTTDCQICKAGFYKLTNGETVSCVSESDCGEAKYPSGGDEQIGGICDNCIQGCQECSNSESCTTCYSPLYGDLCEFTNFCESSSGNPCENGGYCSLKSDQSDFVCSCPEGYEGKICNIKNACVPNPCNYGGACTKDSNAANGYTCECNEDSGFYGDNCENIDLCKLADPCVHGDCEKGSSSGSFSCSCDDNYEGEHCDVLKMCSTSPCQNGGSCENTCDGGYNCQCQTGFYGVNCEFINQCLLNNLCQNGGDCTNTTTSGGFTCTGCDQGYYGYLCEKLNQCEKNPNQCQNGGSCSQTDEQGGYYCSCVTGYAGQDCQNCDLNFFKNNGVCVKDCGTGQFFSLNKRVCKACTQGLWWVKADDIYKTTVQVCKNICLAPGTQNMGVNLHPACKTSTDPNQNTQRCHCKCTNDSDAYVGTQQYLSYCY